MNCPNCGYPDQRDPSTGAVTHYKGIYTSGMPCPHCQFFQGRVPVEEVVRTGNERNLVVEYDEEQKAKEKAAKEKMQ